MLSPETLSYIAGIIDGEGHVVLKGGFEPRIRVQMAHEETVKYIHNILGGGFSFIKRRKPHYKDAWEWSVYSAKAQKAAEKIFPFSITKKKELLALIKHKPRKRGRTKQSHCKRGHPLSGNNLYIYPDGHGRCRACKRLSGNAASKAWRLRQKSNSRTPLHTLPKAPVLR